jgi:drug/metabolite transporter (DMT)-like permease
MFTEARLTSVTTVVTESKPAGASLKGVLLIGFGAFLFALAPIFARSVVGYQTPAIAFYRALSCAATLAVMTAVMPARRREADPRRLGRITLLLVLAQGIFMGLTSLQYTYAYLHTTVAKAVLLNYTAPIYVAILGPWLLKEKRSRWAWPAVIVGFIGIALIADPANLASFRPGELGGILAGFGSGITFAVVFMLGRYLADSIAPMARTMLGGLVMSLMFVPWGISVPAELFWQNMPWLIGLGFIGMALPYVFIFAGQKYVTAQVGSMVALFEPVCGIVVGYVVYAEHLSLLGIIGACAVLFSIYLASR